MDEKRTLDCVDHCRTISVHRCYRLIGSFLRGLHLPLPLSLAPSPGLGAEFSLSLANPPASSFPLTLGHTLADALRVASGRLDAGGNIGRTAHVIEGQCSAMIAKVYSCGEGLEAFQIEGTPPVRAALR